MLFRAIDGPVFLCPSLLLEEGMKTSFPYVSFFLVLPSGSSLTL